MRYIHKKNFFFINVINKSKITRPKIFSLFIKNNLNYNL